MAVISGMGKTTDFKFGWYIHRVHPNESPLKILGKVALGILRDSWKLSGQSYIGRFAWLSLRQLSFLVWLTAKGSLPESTSFKPFCSKIAWGIWLQVCSRKKNKETPWEQSHFFITNSFILIVIELHFCINMFKCYRLIFLRSASDFWHF